MVSLAACTLVTSALCLVADLDAESLGADLVVAHVLDHDFNRYARNPEHTGNARTADPRSRWGFESTGGRYTNYVSLAHTKQVLMLMASLVTLLVEVPRSTKCSQSAATFTGRENENRDTTYWRILGIAKNCLAVCLTPSMLICPNNDHHATGTLRYYGVPAVLAA